MGCGATKDAFPKFDDAAVKREIKPYAIDQMRGEGDQFRVGLPSKQQTLGQPSELAVTAGVLAVGSRAITGTYAEPLRKWSRDSLALLPKSVLLNANMAVVQEIGPCYLAFHNEQKQIAELKASLESMQDNAIDVRSKVEFQIAETTKSCHKAEEKLKQALERVDTIRLASAAAISPGLAMDGDKYSAAITLMTEQEPGVLEELSAAAAALVNHGALESGEEVEVVVDGKIERAQVRRADAVKDEYELSLWTKVSRANEPYEAGFDTSVPKLRTVPRREVYASRKYKQTLSSGALALAKSRAEAERGEPAPSETAPAPTSMEHLSLLYLDAERTLPYLHDLAEEIKEALPDVEPIVAPLKGEQRAAYKTIDKYGGDSRRLTDIARMTIQCPTLRVALVALRFLACHQGFVIVLIKNRLTLAFDASATGGYRDLLLNLESTATKHIVEVQITLAPLLAIKAGGGHAAYQIARVHDLFEKETYRYEGALGAEVLERVRCGIVRELVCRGESVGLGPQAKHLQFPRAHRENMGKLANLVKGPWALKTVPIETFGMFATVKPGINGGTWHAKTAEGEAVVFGELSSLAPVTLPFEMRDVVGISRNACYFAYAVGEFGSDALRFVDAIAGRAGADDDAARAFKNIVHVGGYAYFSLAADGALELCQAKALMLAAPDGLDVPHFYFAGPIPLGQTFRALWRDALTRAGRLLNVTVPVVSAVGVRHFAWLHANEKVAPLDGEWPDGAFVYFCEDPACDCVFYQTQRPPESDGAGHFDALLAVLRVPSCQLRELKLDRCNWPKGRTLSELVDALPARGLKTLNVVGMQVGGELPASLFEKCAEAEHISLDQMALTGSLPSSLGKCSKLKFLSLTENKLEGSIPDELGNCAAMEGLILSQNQLTGRVPASLGKCIKLKSLLLSGNEGLAITARSKQEIERIIDAGTGHCGVHQSSVFGVTWPRLVADDLL